MKLGRLDLLDRLKAGLTLHRAALAESIAEAKQQAIEHLRTELVAIESDPAWHPDKTFGKAQDSAVESITSAIMGSLGLRDTGTGTLSLCLRVRQDRVPDFEALIRRLDIMLDDEIEMSGEGFANAMELLELPEVLAVQEPICPACGETERPTRRLSDTGAGSTPDGDGADGGGLPDPDAEKDTTKVTAKEETAKDPEDTKKDGKKPAAIPAA